MRALLAVLMIAACVGVAWGNGDTIRYDPKSGVILPGEPTPARIEREALTIEFVPQDDYPLNVSRVEVHAEYAIANPTDKPLDLGIGFPITGSSPRLYETPVTLDGKPIEWRLVSYDELIRPLEPELLRAVRRWQKRHPKAMDLAAELQPLEGRQVPREQAARREELRRQFRAELARAGAPAPGGETPWWLRPSVGEDNDPALNIWDLRGAIHATGQRGLLPEGRWNVSETMVDPATGRESRPPLFTSYPGSYSPGVWMLTFSTHLDASSSHTLAVRYREAPGDNEDWNTEGAYQLQYILRTTGGWADFGPIDVTVKAPPGLVFRSLPKLRYVGPSGRQKVYQATLRDPKRNLELALATPYMLLPRLKLNGQVQAERYDMPIGGTPLVPAAALPGTTRRMEQGVVVLGRNSVTVRVRPGEGQMVVDGNAVPLPTPVVVRGGRSYLPVGVARALYPSSDVMLSYDEGSRTVLLSIKPKPQRVQSSPGVTAPPAPRS